MNNKKIYITGLGDISALGYGKNESFEKILQEKTGLSVKTDWENEKISENIYGQIPDVELNDYVKWPERFPPGKYSKIGLLACKEAIKDAKLELNEIDNEVGVIIETSLGATEAVEAYLYDLYKYGVKKISPLKFTKTVANTVLGDISRVFKLNGPSSLLYNENSISYAYDLIQNGSAEIVICGGLDYYTDFRMLSEQENELLVKNDSQNPVLKILEHEKNRSKNVPGEGASFIVLESEDSVNRRGVSAYAELVNYHSNFDYQSISDTTKRSPVLLGEAIDMFKNDLKGNIAFMSAYTTQKQYEENESFLIEKLKQEHKVKVFRHKAFTGDMKAASSVMGVAVGGQFLNRSCLLNNLKNSIDAKIETVLVNTVHEGGACSYYLLK